MKDSDIEITASSTASGKSLGQRVVDGAALMFAVRLALKVLGLVVVGIQARILVPEDFAIQALALAALGLAEVLTNLPVSAALVRIHPLTVSHLNTAFTIGVLRSLVIGGVVAGCAPLIALWMSEPRLSAVLLAMAAVPTIDAVRSPRMVVFEQIIDFRQAIIVRSAQTLAMWACVIVAALYLRNYWALVIGVVVGRAFGSLVTFILAPMRPSLTLRHWRPLLGFSGWMLGAGIFNFLNSRIETLIVGQFLGMRTLGLYDMGNNLAATATDEFSSTITRALYPGLVQQASDYARFRLSVLEAQAVTFGVIAPMGFGLAMVAPEFVNVLVGPKWTETVTILQVLAPVLAINAALYCMTSVLNARGKPRINFNVQAAWVPLRAILFPFGIAVGGLPGLLVARVVDALLYTIVMGAILRRELDLRFSDYLRATWRSVVALIVMVMVLYGVTSVWNGTGAFSAPIFMLLVKLLVGSVIYSVTCLILWRLSGAPAHGMEHRIVEFLTVHLAKLQEAFRNFRAAKK